jgi:FkbH-like protein
MKCVVWDLDHTLWNGILLEDPHVELRDGVRAIIDELDRRGILQSIASKNDEATAIKRLRELGLGDIFLYPQIHWSPKSESMQAISNKINIGLDTMVLLDDQPFERDEVAFALPQVTCVDSADLSGLLARPDMTPRFITDDSRRRREMYLADIQRDQAEKHFTGTSEEFLASLGMKFTLARAHQEDLKRAEELTLRTNQLNTTGYTYSYDELDRLRQSKDHVVLVASLEDRYGTYGKIGLALVELGAEAWRIKLLLMSCRVMSRGVGTIMLRHIMSLAKCSGAKLHAEFVSNGKNRMMYVTYKFEGFREIGRDGGATLLACNVETIRPHPAYVQIHIDET